MISRREFGLVSLGALAACVRERPKIFISHGTEDQILPFERCGKRNAGELTRKGFDVTFRDFGGGHEIPPSIGRDGMAWALK